MARAKARELKSTEGVMDWMQHAATVLGGDKVLNRVLEYDFAALNRLAEVLRAYAIGRALVDLKERIECLEQSTAPRRAGSAA